jgi:peptidoglycan hydrolase-like protein with peptidoglycan-binding domain
MAIYISDKALQYNPLASQNVNVEEEKYPPLTSELLKTPFLIRLMETPKRSQYLSITSENNDPLSIVRIKAALNIIDVFYDTQEVNYDIHPEIFDTSNSNINANTFNQKLDTAIKDFQNFVGIPADGVIGPQTLHQIDNRIFGIYFDTDLNVIGKAYEKSVQIKVVIDDKDDFKYGIRVGNKTYFYEANNAIEAQLIKSLNRNNTNFVLSSPVKEGLKARYNNASDIDNIDNSSTAEFVTSPENSISSVDQYQVSSSGINKTLNTFDTEDIRTILTNPFPEEYSKRYTIQQGDTLVNKIIKENYYNDEELPLVDKLNPDGEPVFTLPARTLSENKETRAFDARLQFYINLLYYANSIEDSSGRETEFGIQKTANYRRYNNDELDAYEMYGEDYDSNNSETALPNYYRFLKYHENNGSTITFDTTTGETTLFNLVEGEDIFIPSREYADAMYYHLNFRHDVMLEELSETFSYIAETATTIFNEIASKIEDLVFSSLEVLGFVVAQTEELLYETYEFFVSTYTYLKKIAKELPRGLGGELGANIGITWGYPIATDFSFKRTMYRKVTVEEELNVVLRDVVEVFVGVDTGIGVGFGGKVGSGKNARSAGNSLAAGARAGNRPTITTENEFPIRSE